MNEPEDINLEEAFPMPAPGVEQTTPLLGSRDGFFAPAEGQELKQGTCNYNGRIVEPTDQYVFGPDMSGRYFRAIATVYNPHADLTSVTMEELPHDPTSAPNPKKEK